MRGHRTPPRRPPAPHACGQARADAHDERDGGALARQDRPEGLQKRAATDEAPQWPPAPPMAVAIGADSPPARPPLVPAIRVRTAMRGGVDLAAAARRHDTRGWGAGGLRVEVAGGCTGVAGHLGGEARTGLGLLMALGHGGWGGRCRRAHGGGVAWPHPMAHEAQPHQGDPHQLVKKEMGNHGKTPSYWWRNEGILPGFAGYRISRRLEVHNRRAQELTKAKLGAATPTNQPAPTSPLPEAPVSITLKATLHGHEVMVTLRGVDFASVKAQVEQASQWLSVQAPAQSQPATPG